jgi:hypothetical protein
MRPGAVTIVAEWDDESRVWWARSDDLPGLVSESPTLEGLIERVSAVVPDLLDAASPVSTAVHRPDSTMITLRFHADRQVVVAA